MKVSDEIRKVADEYDVLPLYKLADRIDAEMVELPKSADGKIWTGREVCFWTGAAEDDRHEFNSLAYISGKWCVEDIDGMEFAAESAWFERPDSFERIADELDEMVDAASNADDTCEKLSDIALRIRILAKEQTNE